MLLLNIVLVLSALAAGFIFWWATALHGIGIHNDSVSTLWVAENLSKGVGFGVLDAFGQFSAITRVPPLYSLLVSLFLSAASILNPQASADQAARLVGVLLSGASIWIFGWVAAKVSNRSVTFVLFGVIILLASPIFWETYLYATPRPLFIFLSLLALYFFLDYLRTFSNTTLFWAGWFVGLSLLTSYMGITLILVMGFSLFFFTNRALKRKILATSHITALGLFPAFLWELRNYSVTGIFISLKPVFTPISSSEWGLLGAGLVDWFSPLLAIFKIVPVGLGFVLAFSLLIASVVMYYRKRVYGNNESQEKWWKILMLGIFFYAVILVTAKLFFDPATALEEAGVFLPIYSLLLLLGLALLSNAQEIKFHVLGKFTFYAAFGTVIVLVALMIGFNAQRTFSDLAASHENGLALNSAEFKNKAIWLELKKICKTAKNPLTFSNNAEKLYWINKTPAAALSAIDPDLAHQFQQYSAEHDIIVVIINNSAVEAELIKYVPSARKIYQDQDGVLFILRSAPAN